MKKLKIKLDLDAADAITLANLKNYRKCVRYQVNAHLKHGEYLHPEDLVEAQTKTLPALDLIIKQYGG